MILSMKSMKCHLESCQRARRQWCKTVEGERGAFRRAYCGACGGATGVMVTKYSNCWTEHSVICMYRQRSVFTQYTCRHKYSYNKEKRHNNERDGWLLRIAVCDMHQSISQIILWWCTYQCIRILRSYPPYNTLMHINCWLLLYTLKVEFI